MENTQDLTVVKKIMDQISVFKNNPAGIQRVVLEHLRNITEGKIDIVDPTNPFVFSLESASVCTAAFMAESDTPTRKQYASVSHTEDDLYMHMSDKDYIDRFASPAKTKFKMLIDLNELKNKMVLDPVTKIKKVVIPRNSEFYITDTVFSLQYPIEIKQLSHGGLQVVYDTTEVSPLQSLTTNVIPWEIRTVSVNKQELLYLEFEVHQFKIQSYKGDLLISSGYKKRHKYSDQFYYARVYYKNNNTQDKWVEIYTTHTDQVYDHLKPTAVLKVYDGELEVMIPQVYFTTGLISGSIRVDIYQTKGPVNMLLENYKPSAFSANFILIDKNATTPEIAAFQSIQSVFPYSDKSVVGGKDAISFSKLRERVINNSTGPSDLPITNVQIETALQNTGFEIVKNIDVVTNRVFLATKLLPKPFDEKLITAASASIETLIASMDQLKLHSKIKNNGDRITLTPELLYLNENGIIRVVTEQEFGDLRALSNELLAIEVSSKKYLYTPFHYVLDNNNDIFDVRAYYLDKPEVESCQFVSQNDTTQLQVNTASYKLIKNDQGFKLYVEVLSNDAYKQLDNSLVHAQLGLVAEGETEQAFINGRLIGTTDDGERMFEFDLDSTFDIDEKDHLWINSFKFLTNESRKLAAQLNHRFSIYYSTSAQMDTAWSSRDEDFEMGRFLLPSRIAFVTKEHIQLIFGCALKNLWTSYRTIPAASPYQRYSVDIPAVYENDVYDRDINTGEIFTFDATGNIRYNILHRKGDPVVNDYGEPVYVRRAGDIILDMMGKPIAVSSNTIVRQMDLMFIEGCYYFANDIASTTYKDTIIETVVNWITVDLYRLSERLLEQTKLYYYPKATMGSIRVMTENSIVTNIEANQSFNVKLFVPEITYENAALRSALTTNTIKTIDTHLKESTISISELTTLIKNSLSRDAIALQVDGLGGEANYQMLTILNNGERCAIKKKLRAQPDGKLIVVEDVTVDFILHDTEKLN